MSTVSSLQEITDSNSASAEAGAASLVTLSKDAQARIEVALYASGRPLSLEEISRISKIVSKRRLNEMMRELANRINSNFVAIELKEIEGPLYSLQLKPIYNSIAKKFATKPLLSTGTLRTLSYIVYLQPVSAHELVQRRGSQAYSHLKELTEVGFLRYERKGRSRVFATTDSFADYFGLSRDIDLQRKQVVKQKGLVPKASIPPEKVPSMPTDET
ncbi:MAG TPA: SMC-Scp complex subunit ScpB [Nitrososphaerales archaeon]|nr:SMC-Scp complex subunit ScpB [Nitrososphaerales archaeon]